MVFTKQIFVKPLIIYVFYLILSQLYFYGTKLVSRKETSIYITALLGNQGSKYRAISSVLDPRKCEYLKDYSLDFEHAYMTTYLAS